jgi:hypothetical protein
MEPDMAADVDDSPLTPQEKLDLHLLHGEYEMGHDLDKLMGTLVPEPIYRLNGKLFKGQEAVRHWYRDAVMKLFTPENFEVFNNMPTAEGVAHEFSVRLEWKGKEYLIRGVSVVHYVGDKMRGEHMYMSEPFEDIVRDLIDLDVLFIAETD